MFKNACAVCPRYRKYWLFFLSIPTVTYAVNLSLFVIWALSNFPTVEQNTKEYFWLFMKVLCSPCINKEEHWVLLTMLVKHYHKFFLWKKKILTSHTFKLQLQMSEEIMKMFCINVYLWSSAALCKYPV